MHIYWPCYKVRYLCYDSTIYIILYGFCCSTNLWRLTGLFNKSSFYKFPASFLPVAPTTMMKVLTSVLTIVALPLLVLAHGDDYIQARRHYARQASSSASSHLGPTTELSTSDANPSNPVNRLVAASTMSPNSFSVSLFSTNPTAVPLASIVSNEPSMPTQALTTEAPGVTPSYMPNAPPLPNSTFHTLCPSFFRSPPPSNSFNLTTFLYSCELECHCLSPIRSCSFYRFTRSSSMDTGCQEYWHSNSILASH